jgi:hypothetical protein
MIQVYLDMDGVIADFRKAWFALVDECGGYLTLREATLDHKIYRGLDLMQGVELLFGSLQNAEKEGLIQVSLLTSAHTYKVDQYYACREQKQGWCDQFGVKWPLILTNCGEEKALFARNEKCLLIDDTPHNCVFFQEEGGCAYIVPRIGMNMAEILKLEKLYK